jgi:hypothetical protein
MQHVRLTYRSPDADKATNFATRSSFFPVFSRVHTAQDATLDRRWRYVRGRSVWLHPIRAETLFALSACLRRQIFIPYAPISRSVVTGLSHLQRQFRLGDLSSRGLHKRALFASRTDRRGKAPRQRSLGKRSERRLFVVEPETRIWTRFKASNSPSRLGFAFNSFTLNL